MKFDNITKRIRVLCSGLDLKYVDAVPITQKFIEGVDVVVVIVVSTSEIDRLATETCAYMSQKHPDF